MKTRHFLGALDHAQIVAAIGAAERGTTGQIRVYVSRKQPADALILARTRFAELGMTKTHARNAVLLLLAPRVRRLAVVGDTEIDARCGGAEFWQGLVDRMRERLKRGEHTEGIVAAVGEIGEVLAVHFPAAPGGGEGENELPDEVIED